MWNIPTKEELKQIPKLYETEKTALPDKLVYLHFFIAGSDWFIVEYDSKKEIFFGYAVLNNDYQCAEWGYISFKELKELKIDFVEVDRDLHWKIKKVSEIKLR